MFFLVHALGSVEAYDSNRNGDAFFEKALRNIPPNWTGDPDLDKAIGKNWGWGYPTFYGAYIYLQHCVLPDTQILMTDYSTKAIKDVRVGDMVVTHEKRAGRVREVYKRDYSGPMTDIRLSGGTRLSITPDHPVFVLPKEQFHCQGLNLCTPYTYMKTPWCAACRDPKVPKYSPVFTPAGNLSVRDRILWPIPKDRIAQNSDIAVIVGFFLTEGSWDYKNGRLVGVQFTFGESEISLHTKLINSCKRLGFSLRGPYIHYANHTYMFRGKSDIAKFLRDFVVGHYSYERSIAPSVKFWDDSSILSLLGTLVDGDGCQDKNKDKNPVQLRYRSTSLRLLKDIVHLCRRVDIPASWNIDNPRGREGSKGYISKPSGIVNITGKNINRLLPYSCKIQEVNLTKKQSDHYMWNGYILNTINSINTFSYEGPVYNLSIEGDESYVANEITVHNCNKDPAKSLGTVEFVHWNDKMKRVELVLKFDVNKAMEFGGDWILKRLDSNRLVDLSMGCFPPGTKISTTYGNFKNIENIQEKDLVLTHTGRIRGVDKVLPRKYNGDMHHLRIYGSSSLHLTPEHPLLVWNSMSNSASWVNTDKLVEGDLLCSPIPCDRESGYAVVNNGCRYITYPITKIDIDHYDGMVYNFSVKIDDSYVAESVAVHNCKVPFDLCVKKGTLITTLDGYKEIQNIKVGDVVLSEDGDFHKVKSTFATPLGDRKWVNIYTQKHFPLIVTDNHPMLSIDSNHWMHSERRRKDNKRTGGLIDERYVLAQSLKKGDCLLGVCPPKESCYPNSLYRLGGYYLAEGSIVRQKTGKKKDGPYRIMGVRWSFNIKEYDYRKEITNILLSSGYNAPREYLLPDKNEGILVVYDQNLAHTLLNLFGEGSHNKFIHPLLFRGTEDDISSLIGAYINGDGTQSKVGEVSITTVSEYLAISLIWALALLNIRASYARYSGIGFGKIHSYYQVHIGSLELSQILIAKSHLIKRGAQKN